MKKNCLIGVRIICFLTLCTCVMYYLSNVLTATQVEEYPCRNSFWQNINAEAKNSVDVVFTGDSSIMHAVIPAQIWKETNITSYVMGYSLMRPREAYFDLKKLFQVQSPKYVVIESRFLVRMKKDNFDYYTHSSKNMVDFCNDQILGELDYYLPVIKYKNEWKTRHLSDFIKSHPTKINSVYKGYKYAQEIEPYEGKHNLVSEGKAVYKYSGDIYIDKIYNLCKNNNCDVILTTIPQGTGWNRELHDKISELADKYDVQYVDYDINLEKLLPNFSWKTDTRDGGDHLNYSGATKVTSSIEKLLYNKMVSSKEKISDEVKNKWDSDSKEFYNIVAGN